MHITDSNYDLPGHPFVGTTLMTLDLMPTTSLMVVHREHGIFEHLGTGKDHGRDPFDLFYVLFDPKVSLFDPKVPLFGPKVP